MSIGPTGTSDSAAEGLGAPGRRPPDFRKGGHVDCECARRVRAPRCSAQFECQRVLATPQCTGERAMVIGRGVVSHRRWEPCAQDRHDHRYGEKKYQGALRGPAARHSTTVGAADANA